MGFLVKAMEGRKREEWLRKLLVGLTVWLMVYNFVLFAKYLA